MSLAKAPIALPGPVNEVRGFWHMTAFDPVWLSALFLLGLLALALMFAFIVGCDKV